MTNFYRTLHTALATLLAWAAFGATSLTLAESAKFQIQATEKNGELLSSLWYKNQSIGLLKSSGAKAELLKIVPLQAPTPYQYFEVHYSAGGGGTHTFSYVERVAIAEIDPKNPSKPKIPIDFLYSIRREKGASTLLTLIRKYEWSPTPLSLHLTEFDEEPETTYVWIKDHFQANVKELDLDLDEN